MPRQQQDSSFQLDAKTVGEFRASPRRGYSYPQRVAPLFGSQMPSPERFFEVRCGDISGSGLSFFLDSQPEFDNVVIALGRPPEVIHVAARVVHVEPVLQSGARAFRVGCCFSHRVYP
jgi:hypothetical protein